MKKNLTMGGIGGKSVFTRRAIVREHKCCVNMFFFGRRY